MYYSLWCAEGIRTRCITVCGVLRALGRGVLTGQNHVTTLTGNGVSTCDTMLMRPAEVPSGSGYVISAANS